MTKTSNTTSYDLIFFSKCKVEWWGELALSLTEQGWLVTSWIELLKQDTDFAYRLQNDASMKIPLILRLSDEIMEENPSHTELSYIIPCANHQPKNYAPKTLAVFLSNILKIQANELYHVDPRVHRSLNTALDAIHLILQDYNNQDLDIQNALSHTCDVITSVMTLGEQLMQSQSYASLETLYIGLLDHLTKQINESIRVQETQHSGWKDLLDHLNKSPHILDSSQDIADQEANVYLLTNHLEQILIARQVAYVKQAIDIQIRQFLSTGQQRLAALLNMILSMEQGIEPIYQMGHLKACLALYRYCTRKLWDQLFDWLKQIDTQLLDDLEPLLYLTRENRKFHDQLLVYQEQYAIVLKYLKQNCTYDA